MKPTSLVESTQQSAANPKTQEEPVGPEQRSARRTEEEPNGQKPFKKSNANPFAARLQCFGLELAIEFRARGERAQRRNGQPPERGDMRAVHTKASSGQTLNR